MYVPSGSACDEPNSASPMTQARIDAQSRRVARVGKKFTDGNAAMAAIVNALTPPAPTGTCYDLTTSASMFNAQAMAAPRPPGAVPVGSSSATASTSAAPGDVTAGKPVLSLPSRGASYWMQPGGASTYPYGGLQLNAGRLVPAWDCEGSPTMGERMGDALRSPNVWGVLALVGLWLYAAAGDRKR
jgi:hypothetical protein